MLPHELGDPSVSSSLFLGAKLLCPTKIRDASVLTTFVCRFAAICYQHEGKAIRQRVWDETLAELSFANIPAVLESLRK